MKIPLYKLFLIQAAYAIALGSCCRLGAVGIVSGFVIGTALSGLILLVRRDTIGLVVNVGAGSIVGGFLGVSCLGEAILGWQYGYDHGFGEAARCAIAGGVIGAAIGGLCFSLLLNRRGKS
jgi:hypothetical protein